MDDLNRLLAALKKRYPKHAVHIRKARMSKGMVGHCYRYKDGWRIDLCKTMCEADLMIWLTHEFAHVPSWPEWERTNEHGPSWSWHYKVCYQIYEKILGEIDEQQPN
jgi:hypothetical protein